MCKPSEVFCDGAVGHLEAIPTEAGIQKWQRTFCKDRSSVKTGFVKQQDKFFKVPFSCLVSEVLLLDTMAQVTVGVLIEERHENRSQENTDGFQVKLLSDSELQKQLLLYGVEPGPVLRTHHLTNGES